MVFLVANGTPWETVFGSSVEIDDRWLTALTIAFAELKGAKFDWNAMSWVDQKP